MRIGSSTMEMESARRYSSQMSVSTSALIMTGTKGLLTKLQKSQSNQETEEQKQFEQEKTFEDRKKELQEKLQDMSSYSPVRRITHIRSNRDALSTVKERCMQYLLSIFFGETKKWDVKDIVVEADKNRLSSDSTVTETVYYHNEMYYEEREDTSFSTLGTVKTQDGREIPIQVRVEMSRSFQAYYEENYSRIQERMCDPLVINLEGNLAEFEDQTFFFDIDADGEKDKISMLKKGSGYLALDKNGDGVINDGNELFGAKTGDGFAELSAYDSDGNGWIDENDAIWEKLLIWTKDENGKDICYHLAEKNVGAICLKNTETDFSLRSDSDASYGRIRKTAIFLYENGLAGTIQHVDVTKQA